MYWLFKLFSLLPLRVLQVIGAGIGGLSFKLSATLRNRTRENLAQAGYSDELLPERIGRNTGRQALESLWVWYRPAETVLKRVSITPQAQQLIENAMSGEQPIVFMTPHIGCFEVLPVWLASTYYEKTKRKIAILYRPPRNPILLKIVGKARQAPGIDACPTTITGIKRVIRGLRAGHTFGALPDQVPSFGEGVWVDFFGKPAYTMCPTTITGIKRVIRGLRAGHTFGALPDQVPSFGEGVWVDFFGKPAYTMTLPVKVAKQFNAVRIFAWAHRDNHGWTLDAELWDGDLSGHLETDAREMNRRIENIVRQMPEQYSWSYNRYKHVSGATPRPISRDETSNVIKK